MLTVNIPGVDNYKFYATSKTEERSAVESSSSISDVEAREAIYDRNRNAISENIRKSGKVLSRVVRGFFLDPLHLHKQFCHLTSGVDDLLQKVTVNWTKQIEFMKMYIKRKDDKKGIYSKKLLDIEDKAAAEYNGAKDFIEISVVRLLAEMLDKDGRGIFLFEYEEMITMGPVIKVCELPDRLVSIILLLGLCSSLLVSRFFTYELWADGERLLTGRDLYSTIVSYFELAFVFQLMYAKEAQTVITILQMKVARYGDDSGSWTFTRKDTIMNKVKKYYSVIGDLII